MVMASVPEVFAARSGVMPHRAFYEMELGTTGQNANIQAIEGRSAYTLSRDCDGWWSGEDYVIEFGGREGNLDRIVSRFSSWEADAGDKYSFDITETSSYQEKQDFGYATSRRSVRCVFFDEPRSADISAARYVLSYAAHDGYPQPCSFWKKDIGSDSVYWR